MSHSWRLRKQRTLKTFVVDRQIVSVHEYCVRVGNRVVIKFTKRACDSSINAEALFVVLEDLALHCYALTDICGTDKDAVQQTFGVRLKFGVRICDSVLLAVDPHGYMFAAYTPCGRLGLYSYSGSTVCSLDSMKVPHENIQQLRANGHHLFYSCVTNERSTVYHINITTVHESEGTHRLLKMWPPRACYTTIGTLAIAVHPAIPNRAVIAVDSGSQVEADDEDDIVDGTTKPWVSVVPGKEIVMIISEACARLILDKDTEIVAEVTGAFQLKQNDSFRAILMSTDAMLLTGFTSYATDLSLLSPGAIYATRSDSNEIWVRRAHQFVQPLQRMRISSVGTVDGLFAFKGDIYYTTPFETYIVRPGEPSIRTSMVFGERLEDVEQSKGCYGRFTFSHHVVLLSYVQDGLLRVTVAHDATKVYVFRDKAGSTMLPCCETLLNARAWIRFIGCNVAGEQTVQARNAGSLEDAPAAATDTADGARSDTLMVLGLPLDNLSIHECPSGAYTRWHQSRCKGIGFENLTHAGRLQFGDVKYDTAFDDDGLYVFFPNGGCQRITGISSITGPLVTYRSDNNESKVAYISNGHLMVASVPMEAIMPPTVESTPLALNLGSSPKLTVMHSLNVLIAYDREGHCRFADLTNGSELTAVNFTSTQIVKVMCWFGGANSRDSLRRKDLLIFLQGSTSFSVDVYSVDRTKSVLTFTKICSPVVSHDRSEKKKIFVAGNGTHGLLVCLPRRNPTPNNSVNYGLAFCLGGRLSRFQKIPLGTSSLRELVTTAQSWIAVTNIGFNVLTLFPGFFRAGVKVKCTNYTVYITHVRSHVPFTAKTRCFAKENGAGLMIVYNDDSRIHIIHSRFKGPMSRRTLRIGPIVNICEMAHDMQGLKVYVEMKESFDRILCFEGLNVHERRLV